MKRLAIFALTLLIPLSLMGCAGSQSDPADTVTDYLEALVAKDGDKVVTLSCADWEGDARAEVDSLEAVDVSLKDAACTTTSQNGDAATVDCTGSLVTSYNGEGQQLNLDRQTYELVKQGGEWRVCGYQ
jgi:hypothetical protein